jgi:hypothetical protein
VGLTLVLDEASAFVAPADPVVSATAVGIAAIADPIPRATANRPILPTYLEYPHVLMWRADGKSQLLKR